MKVDRPNPGDITDDIVQIELGIEDALELRDILEEEHRARGLGSADSDLDMLLHLLQEKTR